MLCSDPNAIPMANRIVTRNPCSKGRTRSRHLKNSLRPQMLDCLDPGVQRGRIITRLDTDKLGSDSKRHRSAVRGVVGKRKIKL